VWAEERRMLRERLGEELKQALKAKDPRRVSTLRLVLAAIKDRDIAKRGEGRRDLVDEAEILAILQKMVKQRQESIQHYEAGGRLELAEQEQQEIEIIHDFLPQPMSESEIAEAASQAIAELDARGLKDMGRIMTLLKERYAGRMDLAQAGAVVRRTLTGSS
jgi:uncharacterized protein YqeY